MSPLPLNSNGDVATTADPRRRIVPLDWTVLESIVMVQSFMVAVMLSVSPVHIPWINARREFSNPKSRT
jgi:hypothetical protein